MHRLLLIICSTLTSFITFSNLSFATTPLNPDAQIVGKFSGSHSVNQGSFHYSLPIDVPAGINGHIPSLSIDYSSQAGSGIVGMGFSLSGLSSIYRCAKTFATDGIKGGVNLDSNDRLCLDGQRLINVSGEYWAEGSEYHTEINTYSRIIYSNNAFKVQTKDGNTLHYGNTDDSNIEYGGKEDTKLWALASTEDASGNQIHYQYLEDNDTGEFTLSQISYANNTIEFSYSNKANPFTGYQLGSKVTSSKILDTIAVKINNSRHSSYNFTYELTNTTPQERTAQKHTKVYRR